MPIGQAALESEAYPSRAQAWTIVIILVLLYTTSMLDRNIVTLLGEQVRVDLRISDVELSLLYGPAFGVAHALSALPLGWAMDRFSRRLVLWAGVTIWSCGTMACGLAQNFLQMFAARSVLGAGEAVLIPGNQSIMADMFPKDRMGAPLAVYALGNKFGQSSSYLIGGFLAAIIAPAALFALPILGEIRGWQLILMIVGLPGVLIATLIFLVPEPKRRRVSTDADTSFARYFRYMAQNPRFFINIHLTAVFSTSVFALMVWVPAHFIRAHAMPVSEVGYWLGAILIISAVIGAPIHGLIPDMLFRRGWRGVHSYWMAGTLLIAIIPFFAAFAVSDPWLGFILLGIAQICFSVSGVIMPTCTQLMVPGEMRGKAASGMLLAATFGATIAPVAAAYVREGFFTDPSEIGMATAFCMAISLALGALFVSLTRKPMMNLNADPRSA
jgi:MFS family permease